MNRPLSDFPGLSIRTKRFLADLGCTDTDGIANVSRQDLFRLPSCGRVTLDKIEAELRPHGIVLKDRVSVEARLVALQSRKDSLLRQVADIDREIGDLQSAGTPGAGAHTANSCTR